MLVISAGINLVTKWLKVAGLEVGTRGGIVVNEKLQTSDPAIFAIGECALAHHMIYGLVAPGYEMADVVVTELLGGSKEFKPFDMSTKLKLIGTDVASFGDPFIQEPNAKTIVYENSSKGVYKRINISTDGKYLLGGILVGDADQYNMLLQNVKNQTLLPPDPEDLMLGSRGGAEGASSGVMSLPDDALICSCEAITKGQICEEVLAGNDTIDAIKKCCKAGTGAEVACQRLKI